MNMVQPGEPLYIMMLSVHGLVRGKDMELGRDPDTGGQVKYVVELAKKLGEHPGVAKVDLLTRLVADKNVDPGYAEPIEPLSDTANIVRISCGPRRYLRKESLWPYLEVFVDQALQYVRSMGRVPDVVHGHYADAGEAGAALAALLGVPFVFTGHSLGRIKKKQLMKKGIGEQYLREKYRIDRRIEAEEVALGNASLVVTSTRQEMEEQYASYENFHTDRMRIIPPGVDVGRFSPPAARIFRAPVFEELSRFLANPKDPFVLALSRADERKNVATLIKAFAKTPGLRDKANLVLILGNRDDVKTLEPSASKVLRQVLRLIDKYDLYGRVAYPKHHAPEDVPDLYRLAARTRGVFVNPALTEPFGLTLIEAAASGVPIVATDDGGPREIVEKCANGVLVDPMDWETMGRKILESLEDRNMWQKRSRSGLTGVGKHFSWKSHATSYMREVKRVLARKSGPKIRVVKSRLPTVRRILVSDIDNTLLGDTEALRELVALLIEHKDEVAFAIATGRRVDSALKVLKEWDVPVPDILITAVGSEIHYGPGIVRDQSWSRHINHKWEPEKLRRVVKDIPGLRLQPKSEQREFKVSYFYDYKNFPGFLAIRRRLRRNDLHVKMIHSHREFVDFLPLRASKGLAIRNICFRWGLPMNRVLVAGDSGNDKEMLKGNTLGVIVGNHSQELKYMQPGEYLYFAKRGHAGGILEGIGHYDFLGAGTPPLSTGEEENE